MQNSLGPPMSSRKNKSKPLFDDSVEVISGKRESSLLLRSSLGLLSIGYVLLI